MIQDALKVRMLGGFTLEYKGREIILDRNIASKTMQLLQIMLLHTGDGGISKTALIEALYGRKEVENKNGSLNNTLFRLRKQLKNAGLPESNYIIINAGICTWDPQIKVSVDVLEFEQLIIQGKAEKRKEEKAQIWTRAGRLYTGEFLPDMIGEDWVAVENVRFRDMYVTCMEELCHYLKTEERYEELHQAAGAIEDIKYRLKEKEAEPGAYYCAFPSFVDIYHVFSRLMERTGISVFIMLCTLDFGGREVTEEEEKNMSEFLRQSIQHSARKGDFYTRYNRCQYLVMLTGISQENCSIVSNRIDKDFQNRTGNKKNVQIDYYVASVREVCDDVSLQKEKSFSKNRSLWS